jgi:hypothetical protein
LAGDGRHLVDARRERVIRSQGVGVTLVHEHDVIESVDGPDDRFRVTGSLETQP